jgi:hypothetical protein
MTQSYQRKTLSTRDHARTAATAIWDALLPTKRRHRRQTLTPHHYPSSSALRFLHVDNTLTTALYSSAHIIRPDVTFDTSPHTLCLTRIGHSSMLINLFGTIILTDPVLSDYWH